MGRRGGKRRGAEGKGEERVDGLRARLGLQGNTSEEAERDTSVAAGIVALLLLLR